jgi:hypothetical protein
MARWAHLWLEAQHISGLSAEHIDAYILKDARKLVDYEWDAETLASASARPLPPLGANASVADKAAALASARLHALAERVCQPKAFKMLNLVTDWLALRAQPCADDGALTMRGMEQVAVTV